MSTEEQPAITANFEFVAQDPIQATFTISPNIQDLSYVHHQDVASKTWTITHNLGKCPSVTIVTSSGDQVLADVHYTNLNIVELNFSAAFAGKAYLN